MKRMVILLAVLLSMSYVMAIENPTIRDLGKLQNTTTGADITGTVVWNVSYRDDSGNEVYSEDGTLSATSGIFEHESGLTTTINIQSWYDRWVLSKYITKQIKIENELATLQNVSYIPLAFLSVISNSTKWVNGTIAHEMATDAEVSSVNDSMRNYVLAVNTSMRNYVIAANNSVKEYADANDADTFNSTADIWAVITNGSFYHRLVIDNHLTNNLTALNDSMRNYVVAVNVSMKNYVDATGDTFNSTQDIWNVITNGSFYHRIVIDSHLTNNLTALNNSMRNYVLAVNVSMKNYVDATEVNTFNSTADIMAVIDNGSFYTTELVNSHLSNNITDVNDSMRNYVDAQADTFNSTQDIWNVVTNGSFYHKSEADAADDWNTTADIRASFTGGSNISIESGVISFNMTCEQLTGSAALCDGNDAVGAGGSQWDISTSYYIINDSDILDINETRLNATIEALDTDTFNSTQDIWAVITNGSFYHRLVIDSHLTNNLTDVNDSMRNYVLAINTSMKNYVDATAADTDTWNETQEIWDNVIDNGTIAFTANLINNCSVNISCDEVSYDDEILDTLGNYVNRAGGAANSMNGNLLPTSTNSQDLGAQNPQFRDTYTQDLFTTQIGSSADLSKRTINDYFKMITSDNDTWVWGIIDNGTLDVDGDADTWNSTADIWAVIDNGTLDVDGDANTFNSTQDIWNVVTNGSFYHRLVIDSHLSNNITDVNDSMRNYVLTVNVSMKNYVDGTEVNTFNSTDDIWAVVSNGSFYHKSEADAADDWNTTADIFAVVDNGTAFLDGCTDCIDGQEIAVLTDADISDTLTCSDLVAGSEVVSDAEVVDDLTLNITTAMQVADDIKISFGTDADVYIMYDATGGYGELG